MSVCFFLNCCNLNFQADEREQKARDFMRAEMRFHRAAEDLKTKHLLINDHQKRHQEMQMK